ncbi:MAG: hypothetical protein Q7R40_05835 [Phaeospirillum sp.]|nr:hypothetical protein [Phaeospirillum sp.]
MLVIVTFQFILGMTVFMRLPGVFRLVVAVVMGLAGGVAVGMAMLVPVFMGMGMGVGMAVDLVAMGVRVGVNVTVLVGVLVLVLVPLRLAVVVMMTAVHAPPPVQRCSDPRSLAQISWCGEGGSHGRADLQRLNK